MNKETENSELKIADLLEKTIGLDVESIGEQAFRRAVEVRLKALGICGHGQYFHLLSNSFMELRRLAEEVVVPETYFFRDHHPFIFLADNVLNLKKSLSKDFFRILSVPCSTGEEPYSIVMTLAQAGVDSASFQVDGIDISERLLDIAQKGVYRNNSFRTADLSFRDRFFVKEGKGYRITKEVRDKVCFLRGNILHPCFLDNLGLYDVVFCRNLLIYFNKKARKQVVESLYNLLAPEGVLFTGYSETNFFMESRFKAVSHAKVFAFYKQKDMSPEPILVKRLSNRPLGDSTSITAEISGSSPSAGRFSSLAPEREEDEYERSRQLADQGMLEEAAKGCMEFLRLNGPSARWFSLLATIRDSAGEKDEAVKLFRKALYLDPKNVESLIHLSLLAERDGDIERAANYKRRVQVIEERES